MKHSSLFSGFLIALLLWGCSGKSGPQIAEVSGTVSLDGKPLPNAAVMFEPEFGRPASASTDENGEYSLRYTDGTSGAATGKNSVKIWTRIDGEQGEPPVQKEVVPNRYNERSTLSADVVKGKNTLNFDLTTK